VLRKGGESIVVVGNPQTTPKRGKRTFLAKSQYLSIFSVPITRGLRNFCSISLSVGKKGKRKEHFASEAKAERFLCKPGMGEVRGLQSFFYLCESSRDSIGTASFYRVKVGGIPSVMQGCNYLPCRLL